MVALRWKHQKIMKDPLWPFVLEKALRQMTKDLLEDVDRQDKSKTECVSTLANGILVHFSIRNDIMYPLRKMARNIEEMERAHLPWRHNPPDIPSPIIPTAASSIKHVEEGLPVPPSERRSTFKYYVPAWLAGKSKVVTRTMSCDVLKHTMHAGC